MTQTNGNDDGILRIGRKGKVKFAFGENGTPFIVDVVAISNRWWEIRRNFADKDDKVPPDRIEEFNRTAIAFVCELAPKDSGPESNAEVEEFFKLLADERQKLQRFFVPASPEEPSSPERTELTFSFDP